MLIKLNETVHANRHINENRFDTKTLTQYH